MRKIRNMHPYVALNAYRWGLNRSASYKARRDELRNENFGQGEKKEVPGHEWRTSAGKVLFKASVQAIMAGGVIHREAITSKMRPGLPEIADAGRFRVVERLAPTARKHATTNRHTLAVMRAPNIYSQLHVIRLILRQTLLCPRRTCKR